MGADVRGDQQEQSIHGLAVQGSVKPDPLLDYTNLLSGVRIRPRVTSPEIPAVNTMKAA